MTAVTDALVVPDALPIHVLMGRVLADLPAIGKAQFNKQQGFAFRGIDDVLNALNPLLSKHGVFYLPDVIERVSSQRLTKGGGVMYEVNLHVRFRFYGPAGDYVEASGWGEGTDSGDKATNKAMTCAMKYVLFQVFAISTAEAAEMDTDKHTPENSAGATPRASGEGEPVDAGALPSEGSPPRPNTSYMARIDALPGPKKIKARRQLPEGISWPIPDVLDESDTLAVEAWLHEWEAA